MKTTLEQGLKILGMLSGVPMEQTQAMIASGFLHDTLTTGNLDQIYSRFAHESFVNGWRIICQTLAPAEIVVTRPYQVDTYHTGAPKMTGKYQVRIWKGKHGLYKRDGHVSDGGLSKGGALLLEWYDEGDRPQYDAADPRADNGVLDNIDNVFPGYEWAKETEERIVVDCGVQKYYVFTLRKKQP